MLSGSAFEANITIMFTKAFILLLCVLLAVPFVLCVGSSDVLAVHGEGTQCREEFECYKCSTFDENQRAFCRDPANETRMSKVKCKEFCVKWTVTSLSTSEENGSGEVHYIRTCSNELDIRFPINPVCIHETRSGNGHLCFCAKKLCNAAGSLLLKTTSFSFNMLLALALSFSGIIFAIRNTQALV